MEDYTYLKSHIQYVPAREPELDALLGDWELMSALDRMCGKSNADLPIYLQFLMEKASDKDLHVLAKMVVEHVRRT